MQTVCRKENANKIELYKPIRQWIRWGRGDSKNIMFEDEEEWDAHLENDDRWVIRIFSLDFTNNYLWGRQSNKRHSYNIKFIKKGAHVYIYIHTYIYKCVYIGTYLIAPLWFLQFSRICIIFFKNVSTRVCVYMYIYNILYIIIITKITNKGQKIVKEMNYNCEICGSQDRFAESSVVVL